MTEPLTFRLSAAGNFNGVTPIPLGRDNFTVSGGRVYNAGVTLPAGVIPADIFGFFAPESSKLVGVAFSSFNPFGILQVIDQSSRVREEITLQTHVQYVLMHPQDRLAVTSREPTVLGQGSTELMLFVNEMNEHEHVKWAQNHPPVRDHIRNRIIRSPGSPFQAQQTMAPWLPTFNWDGASEINIANDNGVGPIPISYLFPMPRHFGCFVSIRYGGSANNGKLIIVEAVNRHTWVAESGIPDVKWSAIQYASHDDYICLDASSNPAGGVVTCDIELLRVEPRDRMRGRWAHGT